MTLISRDEAAEILGVGPSAVLHMARNGLLRPIARGREVFFNPNEVHQLRDIRKSNLSLPEIAMRAMRAEMAASRLERVVTQLLSVIGADIPSADITPEAVVALHTRVEDEILSRRLSGIDDIMFWAYTFHSLSEQYFQVVASEFSTETPWEPYLKLSNKLVLGVPSAKMRNDLELQTAYNYLEMSRRAMRQTMFFYVQSTTGIRTAQRLFPESLRDVHEGVLSMVSYMVDP